VSISKSVGRLVLLGVVGYLFAKGALVLRPRETVAALSALIGAMVHACSGAASASPDGRAALEERRQGELEGECQRHQRGEGDVDAAVLDDAQVLCVQSGEFGGLLLGQSALLTKLSKSQAETALGTFDRLPQGRAKPNL
jgi:hypothetical protein